MEILKIYLKVVSLLATLIVVTPVIAAPQISRRAFLIGAGSAAAVVKLPLMPRIPSHFAEKTGSGKTFFIEFKKIRNIIVVPNHATDEEIARLSEIWGPNSRILRQFERDLEIDRDYSQWMQALNGSLSKQNNPIYIDEFMNLNAADVTKAIGPFNQKDVLYLAPPETTTSNVKVLSLDSWSKFELTDQSGRMIGGIARLVSPKKFESLAKFIENNRSLAEIKRLIKAPEEDCQSLLTEQKGELLVIEDESNGSVD